MSKSKTSKLTPAMRSLFARVGGLARSKQRGAKQKLEMALAELTPEVRSAFASVGGRASFSVRTRAQRKAMSAKGIAAFAVKRGKCTHRGRPRFYWTIEPPRLPARVPAEVREIIAAYKRNNWKQEATARSLGISVGTMWQKMHNAGLGNAYPFKRMAVSVAEGDEVPDWADLCCGYCRRKVGNGAR